MPGNYEPLAAFLAAQPAETTQVTLTGPQIEALLGAPLPTGAATAGWWANARGSVQGRAWLSVGCRAVQLRVRQAPAVVTFVRVESPAPLTAPA